ncbi:hypothetical protein MHU86_16731 [Fragilaria crotonensis]|nr:hypothetical protein MHU86_16731 [Fragilaria crotonensis]
MAAIQIKAFPSESSRSKVQRQFTSLPDVIVIQTEIQANVQFLEQMSMATTWHREPEGQPRSDSTSPSNNSNHNKPQTVSQNTSLNSHLQRTKQAWPTPSEASNNRSDQSTGTTNQRNNHEQNNPYLGSEASSATSMEEERSTTSTRSMTVVSRMNSTDSRFHELEQLIKRQQQESKTSGKISSDRLNNLERQFTRIEELDTKMSAVQTQLEHSNVKLEQSAKSKRSYQIIWRYFQGNIPPIFRHERQDTSHNGKPTRHVIHDVGHEETIRTIISVYDSHGGQNGNSNDTTTHRRHEVFKPWKFGKS